MNSKSLPKKVIALDIGGTKTRIATVNELGEMIHHRSLSTPMKAVDIPGFVAGAINDNLNFKENDYDAISIAVAGPVLDNSSFIMPNREMNKIEVFTSLKQALNKPLFLINDANAGACAEMRFAQDSQSNIVYVTISTGLGAGIIADCKLLLGQNGNAGEAGHFNLDYPVPVKCNCGGENHYSAYISGRALPSFYEEWRRHEGLAESSLDIYSLFTEAKTNPEVKRFFKEVQKVNGRGISNIIMAYNPAEIVIGGAIGREHFEVLFADIEDYLDHVNQIPTIRPSTIGDEVCLLGAAAYAFDKIG